MANYTSLNKAISILKCFTPETLELNNSEISKMLELNRVTVHRILKALVKANLLEESEKTGKYVVGHTLYTLGSLYLSAKDVVKVAEPVVKTINELTGEVVTIGILEHEYVTLVMREESRHAVRLAFHVGSNVPAYAHATGKALLSELTEEEIDKLYSYDKLKPLTAKTVATKSELKKELELAKKTGVAIVKEQFSEGVWSVASIIRDHSCRPVASLGIAVLPILGSDEDRLALIAELAKLGSRLISYHLGYQDKVNPVYSLEKIRSWWHQNKLSSSCP